MTFILKRYGVLSLMLFMLVVTAANAVPAKPGLKRQLTLADGTKVNAMLVGDEFGHYWLGADGNAYQSTDDDNIFKCVDASSLTTKARARHASVNNRRSKRLSPKYVWI